MLDKTNMDWFNQMAGVEPTPLVESTSLSDIESKKEEEPTKEEVEPTPGAPITEEQQLDALADMVEHLQEEGYEIPETMTSLELVQEICDNPELVEEAAWLAKFGIVEYEAIDPEPVLAESVSDGVRVMVENDWFAQVTGLPLQEWDSAEKQMADFKASKDRKNLQPAKPPSDKPKKPTPSAALKAANPATPPKDKPKPEAAPKKEEPKAAEPKKDGVKLGGYAAKDDAAKEKAKKPSLMSKAMAAGGGLMKALKTSGGKGVDNLKKALKHAQAGNHEKVTKHFLKAFYGESRKPTEAEAKQLATVLDIADLHAYVEQQGYELPLDLTLQAFFESVENTPELELSEVPNYRELVERCSGLQESQIYQIPAMQTPVLSFVDESILPQYNTTSVFDVLASWEEIFPTLVEAEMNEDDKEFGKHIEALSDLVAYLQEQNFDLAKEITIPELFEAVEMTPELESLRADPEYQEMVESLRKKIGSFVAKHGVAIGAAAAHALTSPITAAATLGAYGVGHLIHHLDKKKKAGKVSGWHKMAKHGQDKQAAADEEASRRHEARKKQAIAHHTRELARLQSHEATPASHQLPGSAPGTY